MSIFLVRVLSPEGFGWHGIGIGLVLFYMGAGNALFLTQMTVLAPEIDGKDRPRFYKDIFSLTSAFTVICAAISIPVAIYLFTFEKIDIRYLSSVIFASACFLINGFFIKYAYAVSCEIMALRINLITSLFIIMGMALSYHSSAVMSPEISLGIYGLAQFIGALWGLSESRLFTDKAPNLFNYYLLFKTLRHGKWAFFGVLVTWVQSQSYVYVTGLILGVSSVALLSAGRIIVSPFNLLLPALGNLMLPRLAEARSRGNSEISRIATYFGAFLIGIGLLYLTMIVLIGRKIVPLIVGPVYDLQQVLWISLGWCCVLIFQLSTSAASLGLQASLQFKSLSLLNGLTAAVTVSAALPLTQIYGPFGSIIAVGIGEALLGTALWTILRRKK